MLPYLIRVLKSAPVTDPAVADEITKLEAWRAVGGRRKTASSSIKTCDHSEAIWICDAWWIGRVAGC